MDPEVEPEFGTPKSERRRHFWKPFAATWAILHSGLSPSGLALVRRDVNACRSRRRLRISITWSFNFDPEAANDEDDDEEEEEDDEDDEDEDEESAVVVVAEVFQKLILVRTYRTQIRSDRFEPPQPPRFHVSWSRSPEVAGNYSLLLFADSSRSTTGSLPLQYITEPQ